MRNIFNYSWSVNTNPKALISATTNLNKPHSICIILFPILKRLSCFNSLFLSVFSRMCSTLFNCKSYFFFLPPKKEKKERKKELIRVLFSHVRPHTSVLSKWIIYCFQLWKWERFLRFCWWKICRALQMIEMFVAIFGCKNLWISKKRHEKHKSEMITATC